MKSVALGPAKNTHPGPRLAVRGRDTEQHAFENFVLTHQLPHLYGMAFLKGQEVEKQSFLASSFILFLLPSDGRVN